ncbi:MAG: hypothetical protein EAS48_09375 [Chryseobacterium sp.]|nr:MAG: hypothetical protein EAS48_09375 [Chryseobacterium sp.]
MIRKVRREALDEERYSACLQESEQYNSYAELQFLDKVCTKCEFLVFNDYEAVMPLNLVRKFGVRVVIMPMLCQQLGVFSRRDDPAVNGMFLQFLQQKFNILTYSFNAGNKFNADVNYRPNYILHSAPYAEVYKKYSASRRRNIKKAAAPSVEFCDELISQDWQAFVSENLKGSREKEKVKTIRLIERLHSAGMLTMRGALIDGRLQSLLFLIVGRNAVYLPVFVNHRDLQEKNLPSVMIDKVLQTFVDTHDFNFVGSSIPSVAAFNERFGAEKQQYASIVKRPIDLLKSILGKS